MANNTEIVENEFGVDVAYRTIRGRACEACGGKIIPSNRAVYQTSGDPSELFALWECERCGFSERYEKPEEAKKVHGAATKAIGSGEKAVGTVAVKTSVSIEPTGVQSGSRREQRAAAKRAIPPDVQKMLEVMNRTEQRIKE